MFKEIFFYELKFWLKRPGIYIYFGIFLSLAFLLGAVVSGMFGGVSVDTNQHVTSAVSIAGIFTSFNRDYLFGLITMLICVAIMAGCVQRDFQYNCFPFYFTKPISKFSYLIGRFSASFLLTIFVLTGIVLGIFISFLVASNDSGQLGPLRSMNFIQPFLFFLLPNTFFIGTLFFCVVTFTRNMTSGYVGSLVFIVVSGIATSSVSDIDNKAVAALIDPFGSEALNSVTQYWTPAESNSRLIPFTGYILYNRLLWIGLSLALLLFTYLRFSFNQFLSPVSLFGRRDKEKQSQPSKPLQQIGDLPKVKQIFGTKASFGELLFLTRFEFRKISRSVFFMIIVGLSILLTVVTSKFSGLIYGTETYPVTYKQIELANGIFSFFQLILLVFYSGVVIWRERDSKVDELVGSTPVKSSVIFFSKFLSLLLLCLCINAVCILTCMALQTINGYTHYEAGLYFTDLILLKTPGMALFAALGMSVQVFFKNRYFAFFTVVFIILGIPLIHNAFKYENSLLDFNSSGEIMKYSDMNGHGHTLPNYFVHKSYWAGLMLVACTFAVALFQRGKEQGLTARLKSARRNLPTASKVLILFGFLLSLSSASVVYYNRSVLNRYKSPRQQEKESADFELSYKKYKSLPQPRIVESNLTVDIFPDELGCKIRGFYYLKNKHKEPVTKLFVDLFNEAKISFLRTSVKSDQFLNDTLRGFYGFNLEQPLLPGDSLKLEFDLSYFPRNFIMRNKNSQVVNNGSFFNSLLLPTIGYNEAAELSDNSARKKYGLPDKPRMASIRDSSAYGNTYISHDADWIRFECVVSTEEGQTAIAPGYLQKEWKDNNRHYFHYKMDAPILNFYAFLSAEYQLRRDTWHDPAQKYPDVNIEIFYNRGHEYNLDRMVKGVKRSLDYFTKNFSPYQHRQVRIIEFPRYETFAQSFPNTIPFSENIGFIAKVDDQDPNEVDYPFYVTAHEVAHQWWAHQVIGANVQGCTVMSETMAQYSALMVMEKEYGQRAMSKFLRYEMNGYLQGRAREGKKEVPLLLCENQQYIHYNKGSVVMYALKDYLGEDSLNKALAGYIRKTAFEEPPFTTALEFYSFITRATPDSLKETVKDLFERIVVFDNAVKSWSFKKIKNNDFLVNIVLNCSKTQSDSLGKAKDATPNDWVDLGVFAMNEKNRTQPGDIVCFKKIKVNAKQQTLELHTNTEPFMVGIDPYNKLIDKNTANNLKDVNGKETGVGGGVTQGVVIAAE